MKFENTQIFNLEGAIRGMRNPLESWDRSDSYYDENNNFIIGEKDLGLATKLAIAGGEHRKFLRQIFVSVDITAPLYLYKEFDTYKIGTTANSTSTMHKLSTTPITIDCFEIDDYDDELEVEYADQSDVTEDGKAAGFIAHWHTDMFVDNLLNYLEDLRQMYLKTGDKRYWKELIRWLPEGWLQKRTWTANYEILRNIYHQRKNHKLTEWHSFCEWVESLPYAKELILT